MLTLVRKFFWQSSRIWLIWLLLGTALSAVLAGCAALSPADPTPIPSQTPPPDPTGTVTPTATIIWFPATATVTPYPTPTQAPPTPDLRAGLGEVLLQDDFSSPDAWTFYSGEGSSAAIGGSQLTLVVQGKRVFVSSMRNAPVLRDFYAEITANLVFCHGDDEYGLLLRAASGNDFYRLSLSCTGQTRLDRISSGQPSSPQPWLFSPSVPLNGPRLMRLGVWAEGAQMRFYLDDQLLFEVRDPLIPSGLIGVFARSASDDTLTVNFSDLVIYELQP